MPATPQRQCGPIPTAEVLRTLTHAIQARSDVLLPVRTAEVLDEGHPVASVLSRQPQKPPLRARPTPVRLGSCTPLPDQRRHRSIIAHDDAGGPVRACGRVETVPPRMDGLGGHAGTTVGARDRELEHIARHRIGRSHEQRNLPRGYDCGSAENEVRRLP